MKFERPLRIDLPREIAFNASTSALRLQVARRESRFDFEVFFFGQAILADTAIFDNLPILCHLRGIGHGELGIIPMSPP
jgi:hypothetical protein